MSDLLNGLVVKSTGKWYKVRLENGDYLESRILGRFRLNGKIITNPVAVGDLVVLSLEDEGKTGLIQKILPRRNYVARQSPRKLHQIHLLASNVDQVLLISTLREPMLKQGFIDRFLLMTEPHDIPAIIVFNKCDIYTDEDMKVYEHLKRVYMDIGYTVFLCSSIENINIDSLKNQLKAKCTLVGGQSGVGKSSLVNALNPSLGIKTNILSRRSGKGQHTTTFAEMLHLEEDIKLIDTPGIKSLSFNNLDPYDVAHNFREIFLHSAECKYNNCFHREEPHCNVRKLIEEGAISDLRYYNYLSILDEVESQNHWERKTNF